MFYSMDIITVSYTGNDLLCLVYFVHFPIVTVHCETLSHQNST